MSKLETNTIDTVSGTTNLTIGSTNSSTVTFENGAVTGHMYPMFRAYVNTTVNYSDNTSGIGPYNTVEFDTDSGFDNTAGNYKYTIQVAGKYFFSVGTHLSPTTACKSVHSNLYKNGSQIKRINQNFNSDLTEAGGRYGVYNGHIIDCAVGDYFQNYGFTRGGGNWSFVTGNDDSWFEGFRIGA